MPLRPRLSTCINMTSRILHCCRQRDACDALLARMEAAWQDVAAVGNALLRSARSILASNQPTTAPCCLAPYHRQNECATTHTYQPP